MNLPSNSGLTWVELLVALVVVFVGFVVLAVLVPICDRGRFQMLSSPKQLQFATSQMALDGLTTANPNKGWPGDTGGTFFQWAEQLGPVYLTTNDFCKLLSVSGIVAPRGKIPTMGETALRLYAVREDSPDDAVFLTSANFTNTLATCP